MSATILADFTTKTGCRMRLLRANDGEWDSLGDGLMLTLHMATPPDDRHAEVFVDPEAIEQLRVTLNIWAEEQHRT